MTNTSKLLIFEAGGTKTTLIEVDGDNQVISNLPPFNANRDFSEFREYIFSKVKIAEDSKVIFYGSGLFHSVNKKKVFSLFEKFNLSDISVFDDGLGAARALLGKSPGVFGILGTGALAAYYDGENILRTRGGHGYLLGDIGGGFELGKRFVNLWLNGDLSADLGLLIEEKVLFKKEDFVKEFYKKPDLGLLAGLTYIIKDFEDDPKVNAFLKSYFSSYIEEIIFPICKAYKMTEVSFVGSIGEVFESFLSLELVKFDLCLSQVISSPIHELISFHKTND